MSIVSWSVSVTRALPSGVGRPAGRLRPTLTPRPACGQSDCPDSAVRRCSTRRPSPRAGEHVDGHGSGRATGGSPTSVGSIDFDRWDPRPPEEGPCPAPITFSRGAPCWVDLWTSDVEGSRAFYAQLFGWEAMEPSEEFGGYFMFHRDGQPIAGGMGDMGPDMPANDAWKIYLSTDDIAGVAAPSRPQGARRLAPPMSVADLGQNMVFVDPTGAHLGAWQPETFPGFAAMNEHGAPELVRTVHPGLRRSPRLLPLCVPLEDRDRGRHRRVPVRDAAGPGQRRPAGRRHGCLGVPARGRARPLVGVLGRRRSSTPPSPRVKMLGGALVDGPTDTPYGRMATVTDPAGRHVQASHTTA